MTAIKPAGGAGVNHSQPLLPGLAKISAATCAGYSYPVNYVHSGFTSWA
jgi:hypothetical protein